ncbi:MAG: hypothetical protein [Bacteriophage sp.]|nr:MAG: hypothetical protein [Bacteriophage sp.]
MTDAKPRGRATKDGAEIVERVKITLSLDAHTQQVLASFGGSYSENIRALAHAYETSEPGMWAGRAQYSAPVAAVPRRAAPARAVAVTPVAAAPRARAGGLRYADLEGEGELSIGEQMRRARTR